MGNKVALLEDVLLDEDAVVNSLEEEVLRFPFENRIGESVYPVNSVRTGQNTVLVEMSDGTTFLLTVSKTE